VVDNMDPQRAFSLPRSLSTSGDFASHLAYNTKEQVLHLRTRNISPEYGAQLHQKDKQTIVVFIDGACTDNGYDTARAAVGVYFGNNSSQYNVSALVPSNLKQSSQHAELYALKTAIESIQRNFSHKAFS